MNQYEDIGFFAKTDIDKDEDFTATPRITVKQYINQQ